MSELGTALGIQPILTDPVHARWAVIGAYAFLWLTSGYLIRFVIGTSGRLDEDETDEDAKKRRDTGRVIGKAENFLTLSFILFGHETGLALIIAAKSIVRGEDAKRDAQYYLGGTLVNLAWGLVVAFATRALVIGL